MKQAFSTLLLLALFTVSGFASEVGYRYLGRIETPNPAFLQVQKFPGVGQKEFLLVSEFGALIPGRVSVIPNIKDIVSSGNFSAAQTEVLSDAFVWPNDIRIVPQDVFGEGINAIIVPDGFLPPGKTDGNIYVMTTDISDVTVEKQLYTLATEKTGYFYHMGVWLDVDGDGLKDLVSARSNAYGAQGELVWLRHPPGGLQQVPWEEQVITGGPDVMFDLQVIQGYEGIIVFAAEFFGKRLTAYQISTGPQGGKLIDSTIIDATLDQAESVHYIDIDADGKMELLVNNHEGDNSLAAVFRYSVPDNIFKGNYTRRVIASGFKNVPAYFVTNMCPGFPNPVSPLKGQPLHVLLAGDGDYSAHLMRPDGTGGFKREVIKYLGGTVGVIASYDLDGDGALEFFIPNYDDNYIEVYQFYDTQADESLEFLQ